MVWAIFLPDNSVMPQSLSNIVVHVVFSTKCREPLIENAIRSRLHAYLATVVRNMDGECYRAGGVEDHVHLAIRMPRTIAICKVVELIKTSSSKWIKAQSEQYCTFSWQKGYGAISVNPKGLTGLCKYIECQEEHHRHIAFQGEYRNLLEDNGISFDERYVWD